MGPPQHLVSHPALEHRHQAATRPARGGRAVAPPAPPSALALAPARRRGRRDGGRPERAPACAPARAAPVGLQQQARARLARAAQVQLPGPAEEAAGRHRPSPRARPPRREGARPLLAARQERGV